MTDSQLVILINFVIAIVFPLLVGLFTKLSTSDSVKAIALATISILSGLLSQFVESLVTQHSFDWFTAVIAALGAWVIAVASHFGVWKPTGASAAAQRALVK